MNRFTFIAMAGVAAGGLAFVGCDKEDRETAKQNVKDTANQTGKAVENATDKLANKTRDVVDDIKDGKDDAKVAGDRTGDTPGNATEEIHDVLAQVAEAALTKDGTGDIVERFVDDDRNRLGTGNLDNDDTLDGRIDQFRKDWKAKYGTDFDIKDESMVYKAATFAITQGELGKGAAGVEVDVDNKPDGTTEVEVDRKSGVDSPADRSADTNLNDPGRDVASLTVTGHGMDDVQVPLIHEAGGWKIDVPNTLTADKLRANLLAHLTAANEAKDQWPGNEAEAYAVVTHHVLEAVMDKPVKK